MYLLKSRIIRSLLLAGVVGYCIINGIIQGKTDIGYYAFSILFFVVGFVLFFKSR